MSTTRESEYEQECLLFTLETGYNIFMDERSIGPKQYGEFWNEKQDDRHTLFKACATGRSGYIIRRHAVIGYNFLSVTAYGKANAIRRLRTEYKKYEGLWLPT